MQKNLVIVESPAKAKTIEKFLGKDYKVLSSYGHIRDLKKKHFGVDIKKDFEPNYEIPAEKKELVNELKEEAKNAEIVWLASDEDREGEAISWHLYEVLKLTPQKAKRIVFHEITKTAILNAIQNPRDINIDLVNAQQARRVLDRIVGFELSPILWRKVKPSLSAGRVQSVTVRLVVERERERAGKLLDAKAKLDQCWRRLAEAELQVGIFYVRTYPVGRPGSLRIKKAIETTLPGTALNADPESKLVTVEGYGDYAAIKSIVIGAGYTPSAAPASA